MDNKITAGMIHYGTVRGRSGVSPAGPARRCHVTPTGFRLLDEDDEEETGFVIVEQDDDGVDLEAVENPERRFPGIDRVYQRPSK